MDNVQVACLIFHYCVAVRFLYWLRNVSLPVFGPLGMRSDELTLCTFAALVNLRVLPNVVAVPFLLPPYLHRLRLSLARQSFFHFSLSVSPFTYLA